MPKKGGKGKLDRPLSHVPRVPTCAQVTYNVGHCHTLSSQILSESLRSSPIRWTRGRIQSSFH